MPFSEATSYAFHQYARHILMQLADRVRATMTREGQAEWIGSHAHTQGGRQIIKVYSQLCSLLATLCSPLDYVSFADELNKLAVTFIGLGAA